jgi:hypothetical protein
MATVTSMAKTSATHAAVTVSSSRMTSPFSISRYAISFAIGGSVHLGQRSNANKLETPSVDDITSASFKEAWNHIS